MRRKLLYKCLLLIAVFARVAAAWVLEDSQSNQLALSKGYSAVKILSTFRIGRDYLK
jgi:hypothetical protein